MPTRFNLAPNPGLKNNATGWFGPSGWARIASGVNAGLPRTTAFAGTTAGDVATPRVAVTAGLQYSASVSVYFTAASVGRTNIDWYNSGGTYLSTSPDVGFNQAAGTLNRLYTGVVTAPAGATEGLLNVAGLDGAAQVTAVLWEQTAVSGTAYFDGDSASSVWDGADGNSTSTETVSAAGTLTGALPALSGVIVGKATLFGTLTGALPALSGAIGLTTTVAYDDTRGRIRISAAGMAPSVIRAVVSSRRAGTTRWAEVRGGRVAVQSGVFIRTVDDYEFTRGTGMEYRIVGYSSVADSSPVIGQSVIVPVADTMDRAWLKFVAAPYLNRPVTITGWGPIGRTARSAVYPVAGRSDPVVVTDVHGTRRVEVSLRTETLADGEALDDALSRGLPVFLHASISTALPSMYAVVGDYEWVPASRYSLKRRWTIPLTEVAAPPASIVGSGVTWQSLLDRYETWQDVIDAYATWAEVIA